jgi:amino acid transporter
METLSMKILQVILGIAALACIAAMVWLFIYNWGLGLLLLAFIAMCAYQWTKQQNVFLLNEELRARKNERQQGP